MTDPIHHTTPILVVGGGPIGSMTAYQLARLDVPCMLAEQSIHTTKWPKMELTNCRTMEILRTWGLADSYRSLGVPSHDTFGTDFVTSFGPGGKKIASWDLPSAEEWRETIRNENDGSQPAEPYLRCSQIVFESWLKDKCLEQPLIDGHYGMKFKSAIEDSDGVTSHLEDNQGRAHIVRSRFLLGADGGGSTVRKYTDVKMIGGPVPFVMFLVHFRSKALAKLRPFGRFWHNFFTTGAIIIDQDGQDTFTTHLPIHDMNTDVTKIDPYDAIYQSLGGSVGPFKIEIDEVLVSSAWRPNFCIADKYISTGGKIMLAGDSAHRSPPHGGYGMNQGVEEAVAIGFRLAAAVEGYGGPLLMKSYELERRAIMIRALERSDHHMRQHVPWLIKSAENQNIINADTPDGEALRKELGDYITASGPDCTCRGIEMDSRYSSPVIYKDSDGTKEPDWDMFRYTPSTWPGMRAPHVFLKDGKTSTLDLYGPGWSLFEFTSFSLQPTAIPMFIEEALKRNFPLKPVHVQDEDHVRAIWERDIVLVRPDGHVAWRSNTAPSSDSEIEDILDVVLGRKSFPGWTPEPERDGKFKSIAEAVENNPEGDPKFLAAFHKDVN